MFDAQAQSSQPNPVDIHVGARVRLRRKLVGMSQQELAARLGLTFQQVQKYESGANRISASKLFETANALKVEVSYFFAGAVGGTEDDAEAALSDQETAANAFLRTLEGIELATAFPRIASARQRKKILDLVIALAEEPFGGR